MCFGLFRILNDIFLGLSCYLHDFQMFYLINQVTYVNDTRVANLKTVTYLKTIMWLNK